MKSIMVPVADRPECAKALVAAFDLAERFSGNVVGYHVRPHGKEASHSTTTKSQAPYRRFEWQSGTGKRQIELDSKNAQRLFEQLAAKYDFKTTHKPRYSKEGGLALWHTVTGDPEHIFSIIGPLSDLIVVSRPQTKRSFKARAFAHAALTRSGRPVLFVPHRKTKTLGQNILLAWNQSEQSASMVLSSLPFLVNAKTVTIVTALGKRQLGPSVKHVQQYLRLNGVETEVVKTPGLSIEDEIVQAYGDVNADLLMMGAYSRPKWRELVFGGVTQHILDNTQLPTLMMHTEV